MNSSRGEQKETLLYQLYLKKKLDDGGIDLLLTRLDFCLFAKLAVMGHIVAVNLAIGC